MTRYSNPWFKLGMDAMALGMEASTVIGLRTMKIAAGGSAAATESERMVSEKIDAAMDLQTMAMTGALGLTAPRIASKTLADRPRTPAGN
jgi:hypothetical protein